jgi:hypothetical protein
MQDQNLTSAPTRPLSFGEQLVGITFNPSNDDKVAKLKSLFAEAANIVQQEYQGREHSYVSKTLYDHTIGEILNAQMNCVKLVTLKY